MNKQITKKILISNWKGFLLKFLISAFLRATVLILPILYGYTVNNIAKKEFNNAYLYLIISIGVLILYRISSYLNTVMYQKLYNKLFIGFSDLGLKKTYHNSIYSLSRITLGEYTNIMTGDINIMSDFYVAIIYRIVQLLEIIFIYIYFFVINFYIGIITIILSVIILILLIATSHKTQKLNEIEKHDHDKRVEILQEVLLGMKEIKGFNIFSGINKRVKYIITKYLKSLKKFVFRKEAIRNTALFSIECFQLLFFIYGVYLISHGDMELGSIIIIYSYYSKIVGNFDSIIVINESYRNMMVSNKRYFKLLEYCHEDNIGIEEINNRHKGNIIFKNILYGNKLDPILNNVSFEILANNLTVIVGKAGTGKTGIFDLLLRLNVQHEGSILIDGIDISEYSNNIYYNLVSSARKNPVFFNVSIKENLNIIEPNFDKIIEVCKKLEIHDYIMSLEDGYDTVLLTNGENIHSRAKYLLSIARVLLKDSKVFLFDETTSLFDNEAEQKIINLLLTMKNKHTIVMISREYSVVEKADKVIMIEDGEVVGIGTHDELLNENEQYQKMFSYEINKIDNT